MPGAKIEIVQNGSQSQQHSLLIDNEHAVAIARFLHVDPALCLDLCSNVTGVDWVDRVVKKTTKVKKLVDGQEKEVVETTEEKIPGYLEAVYHLYSMTHKHESTTYTEKARQVYRHFAKISLIASLDVPMHIGSC